MLHIELLEGRNLRSATVTDTTMNTSGSGLVIVYLLDFTQTVETHMVVDAAGGVHVNTKIEIDGTTVPSWGDRIDVSIDNHAISNDNNGARVDHDNGRVTATDLDTGDTQRLQGHIQFVVPPDN